MDKQWYIDNQDLIEKHFDHSYWLECDLLETLKSLITCDGFAYFDLQERAATHYGGIENEVPEGFGVNYSESNDDKIICIGHFRGGYLTRGHVIWQCGQQEKCTYIEGEFKKGSLAFGTRLEYDKDGQEVQCDDQVNNGIDRIDFSQFKSQNKTNESALTHYKNGQGRFTICHNIFDERTTQQTVIFNYENYSWKPLYKKVD